MSLNDFFAHVFLPLTLAWVMLGMGLSLTLHDFKQVLQQPKALILGLCCQLLLLPAIAFAIALAAPLSAGYQVGLILMAACPGGISSGLVTHLFKGNVALSIALTTCNSFATLFTIPLTVNWAMSLLMGETHSIHLPLSQTALEIFVLTIIPAFIGVAIRHRFPHFAANLDRPLRYIMPLMLGAAFLGVLYSKPSDPNENTFTAMLSIMPYALLLNALGISCTFAITRLLRFSPSIQITLPVEAGLHNSSLAIFIASSLLQQPEMAMVGVAYGSVTFFTTVAWVWVIYKIIAQNANEST